MAKLLILFGFSWMVVAVIVGFLLARRHELASVALAKIAAQRDLSEYHRVDAIYKWNKTVHAHAFLFSVVAVLIGLAIERMNYSVAGTQVLAYTMMTSAVVWTLGGMRSSKLLMVIGDVALLGSVVAAVVGMARAI